MMEMVAFGSLFMVSFVTIGWFILSVRDALTPTYVEHPSCDKRST